MKSGIKIFFVVMMWIFMISCGSTKKIGVTPDRKDNTVPSQNPTDSTLKTDSALAKNLFQKTHIDFTTFSAKVKVEYQDKNGQQPDANAFIRLYKDSVIWVSLSATFLNIEGLRIMITPEKITILNKMEKTVEYHPISYLESLTHLPITFSMMQDFIVGNPVYVGDSILSFKKTEDSILVITTDPLLRTFLSYAKENELLFKIKLNPKDSLKKQSAELFYENYENLIGLIFPVSRNILVTDNSRVSIQLTFKQYEFNKELSYPFTIPRNYNTK